MSYPKILFLNLLNLTGLKKISQNLGYHQRMSEIYAGNKGLANLGNTCYMNSALQCLSHLLTFHPHNEKFHAEVEVSSGDCLMKDWYEFQKAMWSNEAGIVNPMRLLQGFQRLCVAHNLYFENFDQNDVDEFLTLFLDLIHRGIKRPVSFKMKHEVSDPYIKKAHQVWDSFYRKDYSYIVHNFHSQTFGLTTCPKCEYVTSNHDPIQVLTIEFPNNAKTLEDCLRKHCETHKLDDDNLWKCDKCHQNVQSVKRNILWKTSDVLMILLKRYSGSRKLTRHLIFPEILEIKPYTMNYDYSSPSTTYALQGIAVHSGSLGGGHYYALCKNHLDNSWRQYNDTNVSRVSRETLLQERPYLFFYKRS